MKKKLAFSFLMTLVIALTVMQLFISHQLSTAGADLTAMERETSRLTLENEDMRHKIASFSSLTAVGDRAQSLGFIPSEYRFIEQPPMAYNR